MALKFPKERARERAQKETNDRIAALLRRQVEDRDLSTPPGSPSVMDAYIVAGSDSAIDIEDNYINFDGDNDYIDVPNLQFMELENWTVEYIARIASGNDENLPNLLNLYDDDPQDFKLFHGADNVNGGISVEIDQNSNVLTDNTNYEDDTWHHVHITNDGSNQELFVDGSSTDTASVTVGTLTAGTITLGAEWSGSNYQRFFEDDIALLRIWSEVRSNSDIISDQFSFINPFVQNLYACFHFNRGLGNSLEDITQQDRDGTFGTNPPTWQQPWQGRADDIAFLRRDRLGEKWEFLDSDDIGGGLWYVVDEDLHVKWDGTEWITAIGSGESAGIDDILTDQNGDVLSDQSGDVVVQQL